MNQFLDHYAIGDGPLMIFFFLMGDSYRRWLRELQEQMREDRNQAQPDSNGLTPGTYCLASSANMSNDI